MSINRSQRKSLPSSDAEARLLATLRERSSKDQGALCLVKADAAVFTGLPVDQAEVALRGLARDYRSHLMVTEQGELVYQFAPGLVRRDAESLSQRLYSWSRPVALALWRGFTVAFKIWIAATLVLYTLLFAVLAIALMVAGQGDDDGPGGFLLWWLLPDFGPRRDEDRWSRRRLADRPRKRFHRSVFDFVFGPPPDEQARATDDRQLLAYIRERKGRITASDLVLLTAWDYRKAEEEATRLLAQYEGEPEVAEDGTLIYTFRDLRRTVGMLPSLPAPELAAAPFAIASGPSLLTPAEVGRLLVSEEEKALGPGVWEQHELDPALTGNRAGTNVAVSALNGFNLLASASIGPWAVLWLGLSGLSAVLLTVVPLLFSLIFFGVPAGRYLAERIRRPRRVRRNLRRALLRAIRSRADDSLTPDEIVRLAVRHVLRMERMRDPTARISTEQRAAVLLPLAHQELERVLLDLEGDVALPDEVSVAAVLPAPAPGTDLRYRFPRLRGELSAVVKAREQAEEREQDVGEVIFSSASEGAGV